MLKLDYIVKTKKQITDRGKRRSENKLETVLPKFAYLTGVEIPRDAKLRRKKQLFKKALKQHEILLNPHKFDLEKEEEIMVQPNPIINSQKRRMMQSSIFEDTWATIKIPEKSYREWYNENQEAIEFRRKQNGS